MSNYKSLQHTKWECKYHVVFIPKYRKKLIYGELRRHLGQVLRRLAGQKESLIEEGHLLPDHVHVMISIPPKFSVAQVIRQIEFPQRRLEIPTQGLKKKSCSRPLRRPFPRSSFL